MSGSDNEARLTRQLAAADETIKALMKRMQLLEGGDKQLPLQKQLQSYQQRIDEKNAELERARRWNELIIRHAMDAIIRIDQQGVIRSWNPMACQMFGYQAEEVVGKRVEDVLMPSHMHNDYLSHFNRHLKRGHGALMNRRVEGTARCRDGSDVPVEFVGSVLNQGDFQSFVMVMRDISERKAAEKALHEANANLEQQVAARTRELTDLAAIIEATTNFVGIADLQGHILYVNPAGRCMIGLDGDAQLIDLGFQDFHSASFCDHLYQTVFPQAMQHGVFECQGEFVDETGNTIPAACIFMQLAPDDHGMQRMAVIARDLRKEQEMKRHLEHSQRLESMGVLAGGIAHDFNNILTAIMGNAALASRKAVTNPYETQKYLQNITLSSEKAAELCKQMLAYSGKGQFILKQLNLSAMVEESVRLLMVSIRKNVRLDSDLLADLPLVEADAAQMQQVIMNLVINAADAIGVQEGTITIQTGRLEQGKLPLALQAEVEETAMEYAYLQVADTGCGMDEQTMVQLFDPFFTTKPDGHGLGMSAVQGIVRGHHGLLDVQSTPAVGTVFTMLLPATSATVERPAQIMEVTEAQFSGVVLVIDDEPMIREIATMMLEDLGFTTLTAVDGVDGVAVFEQHHEAIRAVLLDMTMPKMDGKTCFAELRKRDPELCIILSSGYSEQEAIPEWSGNGRSGFVQKPYMPDMLAQVFARVLGAGTRGQSY